MSQNCIIEKNLSPQTKTKQIQARFETQQKSERMGDEIKNETFCHIFWQHHAVVVVLLGGYSGDE